jgi:hypothetical protein
MRASIGASLDPAKDRSKNQPCPLGHQISTDPFSRETARALFVNALAEGIGVKDRQRIPVELYSTKRTLCTAMAVVVSAIVVEGIAVYLDS